MKHSIATWLVAAATLVSNPALAREVSVEVSNVTNATYFTPLLLATHDRATHLFELGRTASPALQAMAEGGDLTGLVDQVATAGGGGAVDPAGGLLAPGASASATLEMHGRSATHLSIVAMLLPSNDGFVGLDALPIPRRRGTYTYYLKAYDAGTEANDEVVNGGGAPGVPGIPADPGGNAGTGAAGVIGADHNPRVHVHRGIFGDTDPNGGPSDLDSRIHRWLNPVARVVIRVGRDRDHHDDD